RTTFLTSVITCSLDECYRRSERHQPKAPILPLRSEHLQGARQAWGSSFGLPDRRPWCGPGDRLFAPGAGAPTRWGGAFDCRSTASVRSEVRSIHRARPFAPGAGAPTGWGDAFDCRRTAPARGEGKPIHRAPPFAPGAGAPTGWGDAFDCRSTASVRSEGKPILRARPFAPGAGAPTGWGVTRSVVGAPPRCEPSQTNTPSPSVRTRGGCSYGVGWRVRL